MRRKTAPSSTDSVRLFHNGDEKVKDNLRRSIVNQIASGKWCRFKVQVYVEQIIDDSCKPNNRKLAVAVMRRMKRRKPEQQSLFIIKQAYSI